MPFYQLFGGRVPLKQPQITPLLEDLVGFVVGNALSFLQTWLVALAHPLQLSESQFVPSALCMVIAGNMEPRKA